MDIASGLIGHKAYAVMFEPFVGLQPEHVDHFVSLFGQVTKRLKVSILFSCEDWFSPSAAVDVSHIMVVDQAIQPTCGKVEDAFGTMGAEARQSGQMQSTAVTKDAHLGGLPSHLSATAGCQELVSAISLMFLKTNRCTIEKR